MSLDSFAQERGYPDWSAWNRAQIGKAATVSAGLRSPNVLSGTEPTRRQKSPLEEGLAQLGIEIGTSFSMTDLRAPAIQRFVTDPETDIYMLIQLLMRVQDGDRLLITDEFACHQVNRLLYPGGYENEKDYHGGNTGNEEWYVNGYGEYRMGRAELTLNLSFEPGFSNGMAESEHDQQKLAERRDHLRTVLLALNEAAVTDTHREIDWIEVRPESASESS